MKPEELAQLTTVSTAEQLQQLIARKPCDVFTIQLAAKEIRSTEGHIRSRVGELPDNQRVRVKRGGQHITVFGSPKAVATYKKIIQRGLDL